MSVIGNNIANSATLGYSRRTVTMETTSDLVLVNGTVGTGVTVGSVNRARDEMLDVLLRRHSSEMGRWAGVQQGMSRVEAAFTAVDGHGLGDALDEFWRAWYDLSNEPESEFHRSNVRQRATQLAQQLHNTHDHLRSVQDELERKIENEVTRINAISKRLGEINKAVVQGELRGQEASSLRDERDLLLDELSAIVEVQFDVKTDGAMTVYIGSQVLVQSAHARNIEVPTTPAPGEPLAIVWENTDVPVTLSGGRLQGYVNAKDEYVESYIRDLDAIVSTLVTEVNALHATGFGLDGSTGNDFFDPSGLTSSTIGLSTEVLNSLDALAVSTSGEIGDGRQGLAIAQLKSQLTMSNGRKTMNDFFSALTGRIGLDAQEATTFQEAEELLLIDLDNQRQSVSGVSVDEEMTALIATQHAYEAMIRVTQAIDEMTATLISSV